MVKKTLSSGSCLGSLVAFIIFVVGAVLFLSGLFMLMSLELCYSLVLLAIGGALCLIPFFLPGNDRNVWMCNKCGCVLERA
jgi:hypothetical protein